MDPAKRMATYEDVLAAPEGARAEVVAGQLHLDPAPLPEHAFVQSAIGASVGVSFQHRDGGDGPGGWWILPEVDVRLGPHDIVRPDLSGWRRKRLPRPWGLRPIDVVPDWCCEILSPTSARRDLVAKRELYARHDVPHYWILDPRERTLTALQLAGGMWIELGVWDDTARVQVPPFDAIELEVGRLFPPLSEADRLQE